MEKHHTKEKGDVGVQAVSFDLAKKGYYIFYSQSEHLPFDLAVYKNGKFFRIQVKYRSLKEGTIEVPFRTNWTDKNGTHHSFYDKNEIDYFAVYCPDTDKCYYVHKSFSSNTSSLTLRVDMSKNNQKLGVNLAEDFTDLLDT